MVRGKENMFEFIPQRKSVMCPCCGKLLMWAKPNDDSLHKIACKNCKKWIWFRVKSKWFNVKDVPIRTTASGKRFY